MILKSLNNKNSRGFLSSLISDLLIHNTPLYKMSDSYAVDALWFSSNDAIIPWLLEDNKSRLLIRQLSSVYTNSLRLVSTSLTSLKDFCVSKVVDSFVDSTKAFSDKSSKRRALKRILLTCKRNSGVYKDVSRFLFNINQNRSYIENMKNKPPLSENKQSYSYGEEFSFNEILEKIKKLDFIGFNHVDIKDETARIFKKDFNLNIEDEFTSIDFNPQLIADFCYCFNATHKSGVPMSISLLPPHSSRMMFLDMLPLNIFAASLSLFPFTGPWRGLLSSLSQRFTFDIQGETKLRTNMLYKLGIDVTKCDETVLSTKVEQLDFPIKIAAPIPKFCSRRMMITTQQVKDDKKQKNLTQTQTNNLIQGVTDTAFKLGVIVPDLSRDNITVNDNSLSILRFTGCRELTNNQRRGLLKYIAGSSKNFVRRTGEGNQLLDDASKDFGLKNGSQIGTTKFLVNNSNIYLGCLEAVNCLSEHVRKAGMKGDAFDYLAQRVEEDVGSGVKSDIFSMLETYIRITT